MVSFEFSASELRTSSDEGRRGSVRQVAEAEKRQRSSKAFWLRVCEGEKARGGEENRSLTRRLSLPLHFSLPLPSCVPPSETRIQIIRIGSSRVYHRSRFPPSPSSPLLTATTGSAPPTSYTPFLPCTGTFRSCARSRRRIDSRTVWSRSERQRGISKGEEAGRERVRRAKD